MVSIVAPEMTTRKKMFLQGEAPSSKSTLLKQAVTFIAPRANTALEPWWNHDTMAAPIFSLNISQTNSTFVAHKSAKSEMHDTKWEENKALNLYVNYGHKRPHTDYTEWTTSY